MSNFDQHDSGTSKKVAETNQTGSTTPPVKNQKLSDIQRIYHWANLISIPIIVAAAVAGISTRYGASLISIGIAYVIISSLINDQTRKQLIEFVRSTSQLAASVRLANTMSGVPGCSSSWVGQIIIILMMFVLISLTAIAFTVAVIGVVILIPILWTSSLKAIVQDNATRKGNS